MVGVPFTTNVASCDVSFQKTFVGINDDLYYSSNTKIDVASYATDTSHHSGQFVYKMGAGGGLSWGYVQTHWTVSDVWTTSASATGNDSGGPIYQITGSSGGQYYGKLFGHVTGKYQGGAVYEPTEKIITNYGISHRQANNLAILYYKNEQKTFHAWNCFDFYPSNTRQRRDI